MTKKRSERDDTSPIGDLFDLPVLPNPPEVTSCAASPASMPLTAKSEKGARKPSRGSYPRLAKRDWTYSRSDVMKLYGVCRNTVTNWIREGLVVVPGPTVLFRGEDLNAFHHARHARARRKCPPGHVYCLRCDKVLSLIGRAAEMHWRNDLVGTLRWSCSACGKPGAIYQSRSQVQKLEQLGVNLTSSKDDYSPSRRLGEIVQTPPKSEVIHEPFE